MTSSTPSILVGVTGEHENTEALRFALQEAGRLRCGITLVHAERRTLPPPPPSVLMSGDPLAGEGPKVVDDARGELERLGDGERVPIATTVAHGAPADVFGELSTAARMIVLQHRGLSPLRRVVTHSTVASVAAHAHCPVVSVPAEPASTVRDRHTVLGVGVHRDGGPRPVLESAFAEASLRRCPLLVLHAWQPTGGDDLLFPGDVWWSPEDGAELDAAVGELRTKYPDVDASVDVRMDDAADALVKAGKHSAMLVVGRHSGLPVLPRRLGHVPRSLVARASCPVMLVPV